MWKEIQDNYKVGAFVFAFLIVFSIIKLSFLKEEKLERKNVTLSLEPKFKITQGRYSSEWVELMFLANGTIYKIDGQYYDHLNRQRLKSEIHQYDEVTVEVIGSNIVQLSKNGVQYVDSKIARLKNEPNKAFWPAFFLIGFLVCLIPLFFKRTAYFFVQSRALQY